MSADLLRKLIEAGTPAELVAEVAMLAGEVASLERRRSADAARQQERRKREKECHVTSRDVSDVTDTTPDSEIPQNVPPHPPKNISLKEENPIPLKGDSPLSRQADFDRIVSEWNAMAGRTGLKTIRKLDHSRKQKILARLREHSADDFTEAIRAVERSPFCRGENGRNWKSNFDFVLQPTSFIKLLEGAYDAGTPSHSELSRTASAAFEVFGSLDEREPDFAGRFAPAGYLGTG